MMVVPDEPPKAKGRHRVDVENEIIRRRERESRRHQTWSTAERYFKHFDKVNTKYDAWTSPRYYEDNNKMLATIESKRAKEEALARRRDKLRKLLEEEQSSYEIEAMVKKNLSLTRPTKRDEVPVEILKDVTSETRRREEERRRKEAELKLYHQWRINNPIVRQYESKYRFKDLKLSWLDQQIEKRMQDENEARENEKSIREQEERLARAKEVEQELREEIEHKKLSLKKDLEAQMRELEDRQKVSEELRQREERDMKRKLDLEELEAKQREEHKRRLDRECVLYNVKQYKSRLKLKAEEVRENLVKDREFSAKLQELELQELVRNDIERKKIKDEIARFLKLVKEQQELEKQRQKHMEFIFDSEAKAIYEKQSEAWRLEEACRKKLLDEVLDTVKRQVKENLEKDRERQRQVLREREEMLTKVEEYDRELEALKEEEKKRKLARKQVLDEGAKLKKEMKKREENARLKEIDEELERVRKEEERLRKEILEIQRRHGPSRPSGRARPFY
ncbi:trichoplein keratin filament-binding protein-like [Cylas formicarius]|uniref:trichoplein keratin filament-binding protein-like n=1 Tax=Cylas formicarius TaxID=197179 RepID=UPI00295881C1|nr:trichoplein keratin filament-binding protein-like [Cylas formicarius]XP_060534209.1 trichoplein keratin filament-binding protein-like [Cylas formicarius]